MNPVHKSGLWILKKAAKQSKPCSETRGAVSRKLKMTIAAVISLIILRKKEGLLKNHEAFDQSDLRERQQEPGEQRMRWTGSIG